MLLTSCRAFSNVSHLMNGSYCPSQKRETCQALAHQRKGKRRRTKVCLLRI
jgi:hypothetical protein